MATYRVVGMMSGTSLDGMDLCIVDFTRQTLNDDSWTYKLVKAQCYPYSTEWRKRLEGADKLLGDQLIRLHIDYSHLVGQTISNFISGSDKEDRQVELCSCHGHTVFHQPEKRFTFQLGDSETIAIYLRCPVVTNFRSRDVALGGQGAPLVPVGERHLYPSYELCLNLGGIANISSRGLGIAYDICPCNMLLNYLAARHDPTMTYDKDGKLARCGLIDSELLVELDSLEYYKRPPPKSLGKEWFDEQVLPILERQNKYAANLLRTSVKHIAGVVAESVKYLVTLLTEQQASATNPSDKDVPDKQCGNEALKQLKMLITGGGAHNEFLIEIIKHDVTDLLGEDRIIWDSVMDPTDIDFKEATVFAFHGLRRLLGLPNVDRRVTGAREDSIAGCMSLGTFN